MVRAFNRLKARKDIACGLTRFATASCQVHRDATAGIGVAQRIRASATIQRIRARTAGEPIGDTGTKQRIRPRRTLGAFEIADDIPLGITARGAGRNQIDRDSPGGPGVGEDVETPGAIE